MKKIGLMFSVLIMALTFSVGCSCKNDSLPELTSLKNKYVLHVGDNVFYNMTDTTVSKEYLTYTVSVDYTLVRSNSNYSISPHDYVLYDGYYYYWQITNRKDEKFLGNKEVIKSTEYDYLELGEDGSNIVVKKTTTVETKYDYKSKWVEEEITYNIDLSNYFTDFEELRQEVPELADKVKNTGTEKKKYYIDALTPTTIETETRTYDEYYYFEKK